MKRDGITGGAYVLVSGGRIVASRGFGLADIATRRRVNPDSTVFGLASTTKLFTSIAAARLAREGRLDLDAPVAPYLSRTPLSGRAERVSLSKLLTHTAGYDDPTIGSAARTANALVPLDRYLDGALSRPWIRPGSSTSYSNVGVALAGHVMSLATGSRFDALVDSTVLIPFGLTSSSVAQPLPNSIEANRAIAYSASGDEQVPIPRIFFNDAPASGGFATPQDMGRLMTALLAPANAADSAVVSSLFSRRFTNHPALPGLALGFRESSDGTDIYQHGGDWQDYSNSLYLDRRSRTGLFAVFSSAEGGRTAADLWDVVRPTLPARPSRFTFTLPAGGAAASRCTDIAGTYRDTRMSRNTVAKLGALTGAVREIGVKSTPAGIDAGGVGYREVGGGVFQSGDGKAVAFRCADDGRATHFFRGSLPGTAYRRLDPVESRGVQVGLLLVAFFGALVAIFIDIRRRGHRASALDSTARITRIVASLAAVLLFLAIASVLVTTNEWAFQYGMPALVSQLQSISPGVLAAVGFALILSLVAVVTAKAKAGLIEAMLGIPALLLVILMVQWNLIRLAL